jgi:signal transduction histidine kinase
MWWPFMSRLLTAVATITSALLCAASSGAAEPPIRNVLTVQYGPAAFPSNPLLDAGIRSVLLAHDAPPIDYFTEYLEAEHFGTDEASSALAEYIRAKYRGRHLDLVIAMGSPALQFVLARRADLFHDVPIVFAGLELPDDRTRTSDGGIASLLVSAAYAETLEAALDLHPSTERVFVVAKSPIAQNVESVHTRLSRFSSRVALNYLEPDTLDELIAAVRNVPPRSLVLYVWYSQDQPGNVVSPVEIARLVAGAAPVPVYATSDLSLGTGVIGGVVRRTDDTGVRVGEIARDILAGRRPQNGPIENVKLVPLFDGRQLARWGIGERRLPAGSFVLWRPVSLWADYRGTVLSVIGVGLLQAGLIIGLLYQRRSRHRAELRTHQQLTITAHLQRQYEMGELAASMAHELNQPLGAIRLNAETADRLLGSNRAAVDEVREILADITREDTRATQIIQRQRAMLQKRAVEQRPLDLNDVVRESLAIVAHHAESKCVRITAEPAGGSCLVNGDRIMLQQVVVNLVVNAIDAMASTPPPDRRIVVAATATLHVVEVAVQDFGEGIAPDMMSRLFDPFVSTKSDGMGIGLTIVRSIVEAHGGTIQARNNSGGGATLSFTLPVITAPRHAARQPDDFLAAG